MTYTQDQFERQLARAWKAVDAALESASIYGNHQQQRRLRYALGVIQEVQVDVSLTAKTLARLQKRVQGELFPEGDQAGGPPHAD